jgi:multidrug efflux pump
MEEQSSPPQLYRYNRFVSATISANLSGKTKLGDGLAAMDRIADEVLDDTYSTALCWAIERNLWRAVETFILLLPLP